MNNDISKRYKFSLDSKSNNTLNNGQLLFNYGDDITLEITVTDGGVVKNIANCEVDLITVNQNATDVLIHRFVDGGITVREDNTIVIVCKSDYVDRLGTNVGQLIIRDEDQSITTQMFSYQTSTTLVSDEISGSVDGINTIEDIMKVIANANLEIENFNRVTTGLDSKIQATNTLVDNLTDRVNVEITSTNSIVNQVKLEESKRVQSEDTRSSNEVSRVNSEYTRVQNEHVRSANEQDRITKETQRVQSETARESAENDRVSEENIRKTNEISRVNSESDRVLKEKERVTEEEARKVAEDSRKSAETTRAQSESQRVQSENTRSSNESNRVAKETERVNNENARKTAETARVTAETSRKNAELSRVTAEAERVAAEKYRADKFYEMEHEYDESITAEVVNNRQGYDGVVYANMYEARKADYETLDNKFGDFTHSTFSGVGSFKADNTKEGLVKDISIKGRTLQNLFNPYDFNIKQSAIEMMFTDENSWYRSHSTSLYGSGYYPDRNWNLIKPNTKYTMIVKTKLTSSEWVNSDGITENPKRRNTIIFYKSNSAVLKLETTWLSVGESYVDIFTFTTPGIDECDRCSMLLFNSNTSGPSKVYSGTVGILMLEGDHTNTPLSQLPYGEGIYSVGESEVENGKYAVKIKSCGKNLYGETRYKNVLTKNGITLTPNLDGTYTVNGTTTDTFTLALNREDGVKQVVKETGILLRANKTYILSGGYDCDNSGSLYMSLHTKGITSGSQKWTVPPGYKGQVIFTPTEDVYANVDFTVRNAGVTCDNIVIKPMLEIGDTTSPFETPKHSKIKYLLDEPLRRLPNGVCDEIVGNKLIRRINKITLDGTRTWSKEVALDGNIRFYSLELSDIGSISEGYSFTNQLNNRFVVRNPYDNHLNSLWAFYNSTSKKFYIRISLDGSDSDIQLFKTNLSQNPVVLYYELATPIITDIGIHTLKGYDGVTNIFMNNTLVSEISARVPMDITSEIEANRKDFNGNLYPSMYEARRVDTAYLLDKVNNASYLEKTGTNITATNSYDGLTKDLSVKGRTLQNLITAVKPPSVSNRPYLSIQLTTLQLKASTVYTMIVYNCDFKSKFSTDRVIYRENPFSDTIFTSTKGVFKIQTPTDVSNYKELLYAPIESVTDSVTISELSKLTFLLLEGDYTNVPLSELPYIEGIQSTGEADVVEGKYPISVKSYGKNIIDIDYVKIANMPVNQWGHIEGTAWKLNVPCKPNTRYYMKYKKNSANYRVCVIADRIKNNFEENESHGSVYGKVNNSTGYEIVGVYGMDSGGSFVTPEWANYLHFTAGNTTENTNSKPFTYELSEIMISEVDEPYEPYRESSIKYLLDEPLRGLPNGVADEIIGNQLIRRVGKYDITGMETWYEQTPTPNSGYDNYYRCTINNISNRYHNCLCDTLISTNPYDSGEKNIIYTINNQIRLRIKDKNTIDDVKQWLQANPTTVYYELATPMIATLDEKLVLNTYDTTTHITSDNTLLPKITAKVPSNVQAVVANLMEENKELNNQVSTLSVENEELKATNEVQDEMIDVTMCATDEMFTMLEPLLAQVMEIDTLNTNNKEVVNPMVDMYVAMVQRGLKTIDQVPARYREQVEAILAELDK